MERAEMLALMPVYLEGLLRKAQALRGRSTGDYEHLWSRECRPCVRSRPGSNTRAGPEPYRYCQAITKLCEHTLN
jgi:hypothetical protein